MKAVVRRGQRAGPGLRRLGPAVALCLLGLPPGAAAAGEYACEPTPTGALGSHYRPATVERSVLGQGLMVRGQVLSAEDCRPIAGARVEHWQVGYAGEHLERLRARQRTDADGRFRFETEWPMQVPPHIHFRVTADGHEALATRWVGASRVPAIAVTLVLEPLPEE